VRVRQVSATVAAAVVIAGAGFVMAAPPAAAASIAVDCASGVDATVTAVPGELINITGTNCNNDSGTNTALVAVTIPVSGDFVVEVLSSTAPGTYAGVTSLCTAGGACVDLNLVVVAAAKPIPDWVQSYGRFGKDATCLQGWNPTWEKWAEPITGGWTCTRTIPSLG
jgi:hypothetical protein